MRRSPVVITTVCHVPTDRYDVVLFAAGPIASVVTLVTQSHWQWLEQIEFLVVLIHCLLAMKAYIVHRDLFPKHKTFSVVATHLLLNGLVEWVIKSPITFSITVIIVSWAYINTKPYTFPEPESKPVPLPNKDPDIDMEHQPPKSPESPCFNILL